MTNKITRRAFLKCTGAVAVAAGMAGALSGCDLVDNIMNNVMDQNDVNGVTFDSVGVSCNFISVCRADSTAEDGQYTYGHIVAMYADFDFSSLSRDPYTIKASDFTLELDGKKAEVVTGEAAKAYCGGSGYNFLFGDKDSVTLSAFSLADENFVNNCAADGIVVFKLPEPVDSWEKVTLKVKVKSGTAVFTGTPKNDGNVVDVKVNR